VPSPTHIPLLMNIFEKHLRRAYRCSVSLIMDPKCRILRILGIFGNMLILPRINYGVAMLRRVEANILPGPKVLDVTDTLMQFMDFGITSFHEPVFTPADINTHTVAAIQAIESGKIQILDHPGKPNYPIHIEEVVRAARDHNVLIEINN
jgi:putative hydrolase